MTTVEPDDLIELGHVPRMGDYLRDIWSRREFAVAIPWNDLRAQNMDTVLGQLWHFLNPALNVFVYYVIFGLVLEVNRGVDNYVGFLAVGVLFFNTTTRLATSAVQAMERDAGLIRTVQFPRAIIPISSTVMQAFSMGPAIVVLMGALLLTGESPDLRWLLAPVVLGVHTVLNLGIAFVLARAGFGVRDLSQMIQHVFRFLFYGSGVLFLPSRFVDDPDLIRLFALNPLYDLLTFARWVFMDLPMTSDEVIGLIVWTTLLPVVGLWWFVRAEHRYGG